MARNKRVLEVDVIGDISGLQKQLTKAVAEINRLKKAQNESNDSVSKSSKKTTNDLNVLGKAGEKVHKGLTNQFHQVAKAAIGLGAAFATFQGAKDAISTTEELAHTTLLLHKTFGLSIKSASEWAAQAKARNIDAKQLGMGFKTLATATHNATQATGKQSQALIDLKAKQQQALTLAVAEGKSTTDLNRLRVQQAFALENVSKKSSTQLAIFKELGISQQDLKKHGNDMNYMLHAVSDGFKNLGPGVDKAATMSKLFGRTWQTLNPILRDGSKAMDQQLQLADKYGVTFKGKTVKSLEDLIAAQRESKFATMGLQVAFGQYLAPALTKAITAVNGFVLGIRNGTGAGGKFADTMKKVWSKLQPLISALRTVVRFLGQHPALLAAAAGAWAAYKVASLAAIGATKLGLLSTFGSSMMTKLTGEAATAGTATGTQFGIGLKAAARGAGIAAAAIVIYYLQKAAHDSRPIWDRIINPVGPGVGSNANVKGFTPSPGMPAFHPDSGPLRITGYGNTQGFNSPAVVPKSAFSGGNYRSIATAAARSAGIDPRLFLKQINQESGFNPNAVSGAGAIGIAQFMPGTAKGLNLNPHDPVASLKAAAKLMASYVHKYGSYANALVAYNAGPGAVGHSLPAETQNYVASIMGGGGIDPSLLAPGALASPQASKKASQAAAKRKKQLEDWMKRNKKRLSQLSRGVNTSVPGIHIPGVTMPNEASIDATSVFGDDAYLTALGHATTATQNRYAGNKQASTGAHLRSILSGDVRAVQGARPRSGESPTAFDTRMAGLINKVKAAKAALVAFNTETAKTKALKAIDIKIRGIEQAKAFKSAISDIRKGLHDAAATAASAFRATREGEIGKTHDAAIKAIGDSADAQELARLQKEDQDKQDAKTEKDLNKALADAIASGDKEAIQNAQDDIEAYKRGKREQELHDNIDNATKQADDAQQTALDGLDKEEQDFKDSLDKKLSAEADQLAARKINYKQFVDDLNTMLAPYGLSALDVIGASPEQESAIKGGPGGTPSTTAKPGGTSISNTPIYTLGGSGPKYTLGGHRAMGGPVRRGAAYIVGEHGQELFVPSSDGRIVPNAGNKMRGNGAYVHVENMNVRNSTDVQRWASRTAFKIATS